MCGIVGLSGGYNKTESREIVHKMISRLSHRGPDEWGSYVSDGIAFGHTRLSIIDISGGHQPMDSGESCISYNGEIYNYIELKQELESQGCVFLTKSDTEVLQKALDIWGTDALSRLNGQFAFLYWNKKRNELIVARDRYGIRPLYYIKTNNGYAFASEIKAFREVPGFTQRWDVKNLLEHGLLWNTLDNRTVFQGVYSLPGGCFKVFSKYKEMPTVSYYHLGQDYTGDTKFNSISEACSQLTERLNRSVELRLRSDVPVGCYLSGGIDSSVTSYLAHNIKHERFNSFSVAFKDEAFDESAYQRRMVEQLGSDHHTVIVDETSIQSTIVDAAQHFERPVFRTAPIPLFLLSQKVKESGIKVVLTGEAADEILFGYDSYKEVELLRHWSSGMSDESAVNILKAFYPHLNHYKNTKHLGMIKMYYEGFKDTISGPLAGLLIRASNNRVLGQMLNPDHGVKISLEDLSCTVDELTPTHIKEQSLLRRAQYWEMKTLLSGYLLSAQGDRMAMAHSIEGRFPFLDHTLVEWAFALPREYKLTEEFSQKFVLREAFRSVLPAQIIDRPKRPYTAPDLSAFFTDGKPGMLVNEYLSEAAVKNSGVYDPKMAARLLHKLTRRGTANAGYRDNMLITFMLSTQIIDEDIQRSGSKKHLLQESGRVVDIID